MLVNLLEPIPKHFGRLIFSKQTRLSREELRSQVGQCRGGNFVVVSGFTWIEVLVTPAGSDECFEPAQDVRRFTR